jgi:hypothetical protein
VNKPSAELSALRNLIAEAENLLATRTLPERRSQRALELLRAALALADDLSSQSAKPAATLGAKGGAKTAERGPDYFKKIASMRKVNAGGRPKKVSADH